MYGVFDADPASQTLKVNGTLTANNLSGINTGDQVGDGSTITGAGTEGDPFVATTGGSASYLVYTALLTQSGTSDPTATVLENTIGNIVWSYGGVGQYIGTLAGAFVNNKTFILIQIPTWGGDPSDTRARVIATRTGNNTIQVTTANETNTLGNDALSQTSIEIRVYP
ncbi:MAG: hypothetical protein WC264_03815 [Candidatus Paceibacterota bacterium]|jgi:hypothetical protein